MKFKTEPVLWLTAVIMVLNAVLAYLTHGIDLGTAVNLIVEAVGGLIVRNSVTPIVKLIDEI